jgi:hypothetical protein
MTYVQRATALLIGAAFAPVIAVQAAPSGNPKFCVFDIVGAQGDAFNMTKDYMVAMQRHGVTIELKPYTSEAQAVEDFRSGVCDAVVATAFRTRPFNKVAGSIDSLGSTTIIRDGKIDMAASYQVVRTLVQTFSATSPLVSKLMVQGDYEVGGILPVGAAFPMTNDRRLNTVEALAGKRLAALEYDKAQGAMVKRVGGIPVYADITTLVPKFNAGQMDMIFAPTLAYKPLEIQKGIGPNGGIGRFPLLIMTYQMIINRPKFPEGFGDQSRKYWLTQFDRVMQLIKASEAAIPMGVMIELSPENTYKYTLMLREARIDIAEQGIYDKRGLKIIKRVRCSVNPADPECGTKSEEEWK